MLLDDNKVGKITYIGKVDFSDGIWYGLVMRDKSGKNDGNVQNRRYFSTTANKGLFVKRDRIQKTILNCLNFLFLFVALFLCVRCVGGKK